MSLERAARAALFLSGLIATFGGLLLVAWASGSAWLPVAFGLGIGALLRLLPLYRETSNLNLWTAGLVALIFLFWVRSERGMISFDRIQVATSQFWVGWVLGLALTGIVLLVALFKTPYRAAPLLLLLVFAVILATASGSGGGAGRMVDWVIRTFHLSRDNAEIAVIAFRKVVHFSYYGANAGVAYWVARGANLPIRKPFFSLAAASWALSFAGICACFDELRQSTEPGRTGSFWDVLLDLAGAAYVVALMQRKALRQTLNEGPGELPGPGSGPAGPSPTQG